MEPTIGEILVKEIGTVTDIVPVAETESGMAEPSILDKHEEEGEEHWPMPVAAHLDIHQRPPSRHQSSTPSTDDTMAANLPEIDQLGAFQRGNGIRRPMSKVRVRVLKHDLESRESRQETRNEVAYFVDSKNDAIDVSTNQHAPDNGSTTSRKAAKSHIITFPQFAPEVNEEQAAASAFRRARSFIDKGNRSAVRDFDSAHIETGANNALRRQVESRRSYAVKTHTTPAQARSAGKGPHGEERTSDYCETFTGGLYPQGTSEYIQAKVAPTSARRHSSKYSRSPKRPTSPQGTVRNGSEATSHHNTDGPPVPTPAIGEFQQLDIVVNMTDGGQNDMNELKENHPPSKTPRTRDSNRWKSAKRDNSDPGVSNTTQMLLEAKMRTKTLSFPEISVEEQRRALGSPRNEPSSQLLNRRGSARSPTRSPTRSQRRSPKDQDTDSRERLPVLDNHACSPQISVNLSIDASATADKGTLKDNNDSETKQVSPVTPRSKAKELSGSIISLNSDFSKKSTSTATTFTNHRDRYSRMIALGLPRVNLDIEKNHFSRQSLKRRSQTLREKFEMRPGDGTSNGPMGPGVSRSEPPPDEPTEHLYSGCPGNSSHVGVVDETDTDVMWPGNGRDLESVVLKTYNQDGHNRSVAHVYIDGMNLPDGSSGDPPLTSVPKGHGTGQNGNGGFNRQTSIRGSRGKHVNYTYFRMMPPGQVNCTPASSVIESPRTPKVPIYQSAA